MKLTMTRTLLSAAVIAVSSLSAQAATFGEFWNADSTIDSLAAAEGIIAAGGPDATFISTGIDYPNGVDGTVSDATTLETYLGVDAASLSGGNSTALTYSVFRFTGQIALDGLTRFAVGSDDGFQLIVDGALVSAFDGLRPFDTTVEDADLGTGLFDFELIYFENEGVTGVEFRVDGSIVTGDTLSVVPLPAGGVLLLTGLAGLVLHRRRKSA